MHYSLLYISRVVNPDNEDELDAIREQSIELNQANGLTGLLLWSREYFCQILQGRKATVEKTMQRIARDKRHLDPIVLLRTDLAEALFPNWSMATSHVEDAAMANQIASAYNDRLADLSVVDGIIALMQQFQQNNLHRTPKVYSRTGFDQQLATLATRNISDKAIDQVLQLGSAVLDGCALVLLLQTAGGKGHYVKSSAGIEPVAAESVLSHLAVDTSLNGINHHKVDSVTHQVVNIVLPKSTPYGSATGCVIRTTVAPLSSETSSHADESVSLPAVIGSLWVLFDDTVIDMPGGTGNIEFFRIVDCLESLLEQKLQSHANELLRQMSRRQQLSLAAGNRRQEMVMNVASSAIIALDRDCRVLIINDTARRLFGQITETVPFHWPASITFLSPWSLEPLPGPVCPIFLAATNNGRSASATLDTEVSEPDAVPADADSESATAGSAATESNVTIVALQSNDSEPLKYLRVASSITNEPESAISGVVVFDDITELQHNRERIRRSDRLEALGHLTGGIAHDFNNLLSTIQSSVELATIEPVDDTRQAFLDVALDSVQRGADLTDKLVAFAVARPVSARAHQLADILQSVAELATASIEQDINFVVADIPETLAVHCDGGQLENALLNVLINSRDAIIESGKGDTVSIAVRSAESGKYGQGDYRQGNFSQSDCRQGIYSQGNQTQANLSSAASAAQAQAGQKILISVTDNGPGMSAEVIRRATDPFFTTRGGGNGSGLGLSMVYRFVEQSDGELLIENLRDSDPGKSGVRVTLILDQAVMHTAEDKVVSTGEPQPPPQSRATVLLVEDETSLAEMLQQSLSRFGLDTRVAHSADTALRELNRDTTIDLLLTDIVMPGSTLDGYSLAAKALQLKPGLKVVYLSGYPQQSGKSPAITYGPLIKKPVSMKKLVTVIRTELGQQSEQRSEKEPVSG